MIIKELYNSITKFANKYGSRKFNDVDNIEAYNKVVDDCIKYGKIPECNRYEFSTHSSLIAAITYESDRERFCKQEVK